MFSKSKRFIAKDSKAPAVGQYDILQSPSNSSVIFPKDKRFKETAAENNDTCFLDTSNCSTLSAKSSSSGTLDRAIFATPGKPCRKARNVLSTDIRQKCKSGQPLTSDEEKESLVANIAKLLEEIEQLKRENEMLQKVQGVDESREVFNSRITTLMQDVERLTNQNDMLNSKLNEMEVAAQDRQSLESNLAGLNDELEKLRNEIEKEILRNKELVIEQSKYECSIATINTDLDLANSKVTVLQEQINSLEQLNTEMCESRDDTDNQCAKLHGMTLGLQELNITLQVRLEEVEDACKSVTKSKENVEIQFVSWKEEHKSRVQTLEFALSEKMSSMMELNGEKRSLEECIGLFRMKIEHLQKKLQEDLEAQRRTTDQIKLLNEERDGALITVKQLKEKQEDIVHCAEQEMSQLRNEMNRLLSEERDGALITVKQLKEKQEDIVHCAEQEMSQLRNEMKRLLSEERDGALITVKQLREKQEDIVNCAEHEMSQLRNEMNRKDDQSLQSIENLTEKCRVLEDQLVSLQQGRTSEVENLQKELEVNKISFDTNQEEYKVLNKAFKEMEKDYNIECTNRSQLENDFKHVKEILKTVELDLTKAKAHIVKLEDSEQEHREAEEAMSIKLNERDNTIHDLERKNYSDNEAVVCANKRDICAAEEKAGKLKQEFGRRLVETQKKLSQKEIELASCHKEFNDHVSKCNGQERHLVEIQKELSQKEIELESCQREFEDHISECNSQQNWKKKFEELAERISPFQEQLDAYEFEKQSLLSQNSESQSEIDKLGQQYAKLLGHQNQKQKIRHVLKLKEENNHLKKEVAKLREQTYKQKQSIKKFEDKWNKATGERRFDPSLAFQHSARENKENTPLKTLSK